MSRIWEEAFLSESAVRSSRAAATIRMRSCVAPTSSNPSRTSNEGNTPIRLNSFDASSPTSLALGRSARNCRRLGARSCTLVGVELAAHAAKSGNVTCKGSSGTFGNPSLLASALVFEPLTAGMNELTSSLCTVVSYSAAGRMSAALWSWQASCPSVDLP